MAVIVPVLIILFIILFLFINETALWIPGLRDYGRALAGRKCADIMMTSPGNRRAVLMLHEFSGGPSSLEYAGKKLLASGFDVFIPAMPGSAESEEDYLSLEVPPYYDHWRALAGERYRALLASYDCVFLYGASLGGSVALDIAATIANPAAIVTVSSPVRLTGGHFRRALSRNAMIVFSGVIALFVRTMRTGRLGEEARKIEIFNGAEGVLYPLSIHLQKVRLRELKGRLGRVKCPALLFHSPRDRTVDFANRGLIARSLGSDTVVERTVDLERDALTRCHRLSNHLWVRDAVADETVEFFHRHDAGKK